MSLFSFKFSLYELTFCSYNHSPVNGCLQNIQPLNEIVQTINVVNLLDPSQKYTIVYVYYKQNDIITGLGYLCPKSAENLRGSWVLSQVTTNVISSFLFDGIPSKSVLINAQEKFYVYDNKTGKTVYVELIIENSIVSISGTYTN